MHKITKLGLLGLAFATMIGLSACGDGKYETGDGLGSYHEFTLTMKDGRTVPCVGAGSSMSCDWANATVPAPRVKATSVPEPTSK